MLFGYIFIYDVMQSFPRASYRNHTPPTDLKRQENTQDHLALKTRLFRAKTQK